MTTAPAHADPSIGDVQSRVDQLYRQAEKASERFNDARIERDQAREALAALKSDIREQRREVSEIRDQVVAAVVAQYQGQPLSEAARIVLADDPDEFLGQMTTITQYSAERSQAAEALTLQVQRLEERKGELREQLAAIADTERELGRERSAIRERADEADKLLARLKERAREERASRSESRMPTATASGAAASAVQFAMAQVGDAYVWGAAGPDAYDCSGLTMAAWAAAGVSLPHSSSAQMGSGTPVSVSALQPGDLVFYYSPVSHVGIYVGNGTIVHAANPSQGVRTDPVDLMPITGAVRPG